MDCRDVRAHLQVRPEADRDRRAVESHLRTCEACERLAARHASLDAILRESLVVDPPAELGLRLLALARPAPARRPAQVTLRAAAPARHPSAVPPSPRWQFLAYATAALAALLAGDPLGWQTAPLAATLWGEALVTTRVLLTSPPAATPGAEAILSWVAPVLSTLALPPLAWLVRAWTARQRAPEGG